MLSLSRRMAVFMGPGLRRDDSWGGRFHRVTPAKAGVHEPKGWKARFRCFRFSWKPRCSWVPAFAGITHGAGASSKSPRRKGPHQSTTLMGPKAGAHEHMRDRMRCRCFRFPDEGPCSWVPAFAGITHGAGASSKSPRRKGPHQSTTLMGPKAGGHEPKGWKARFRCFRFSWKPRCSWVPAFAGMTHGAGASSESPRRRPGPMNRRGGRPGAGAFASPGSRGVHGSRPSPG